MDSIMKEFEHLVVKLEEVKSATDNFNDTKIIGKGGFGNVYEGEVSQPRGKTKAAFKRLNPYYGQGNPEFWKEIMMLSLYTHENLISLLGFCDEGGEKILVYEHASNGSLDRHLSSTTLTWTQRIRICHDAAKGLCYLHEDKGNHHRVLHRDIKSSNILLDKNWKAKVSDMGLAKVATQFSFLITSTVGTLGYIDPMYLKMGFLTKESDVYSFGVVLFEVLCGRLCLDNSNARSGIMVHIWKQRYEENKLYEIIFKDDLIEALDWSSFEMFSQIAFQCLQDSREKRPKMSDVVEKLDIALKSQELVDLTREYLEIVKAVVPPLIYRTVEELKVLLSKGVILNGGKKGADVTDLERGFLSRKGVGEGEDGGLQDGNTGNGRATGQVHEVTNDGIPKKAGFDSVMKEAPTSYANKISPTSLIWVKFHAVPLVVYTSDGLSLIIMKIDTSMMLDSFTNSMCLESWGRSSYPRILEIDSCNGFSDNLVMVVLNLKVDDCPKALKRVMNNVDKVKGGSFGADDDGSIKASPKMAPPADKKKVSTTGNSSKKTAEKINIVEQQVLAGKCMLLDDEGKPVKKIDYMGDHDSEDEVEPVDNEMASFLASNPSGVGYGTNSLLEQLWGC
ncbi:kinase-like domain, phloem protein 2-like protein [Tanacetum coccineum]